MVWNVTALDRVGAKTAGVYMTLMAGEERIDLDMDHKTALDIAQTIADALRQLGDSDVNPDAGVCLYEATKFEADLEPTLGALGAQEKFVLTAHGQGSTKITLRLAPERLEKFLAQIEMHASRRRGAAKN